MKDIYKTIFIYDTDIESEYFESILNILSNSAFKVMKVNKAIDFILKLKSCNFSQDTVIN